MFENLRKKSLVKTYNDPRYSINFEQGHVIYLDSFSFAQHKQILSKKKVDKPFSSTFERVSKEFRLLAYTLKDVQFNMIYCSSGTFIMGHECQENNPPREETIDRPFLLGETEVTQELYEKVMGTNPSIYQNNSQKPIENVSWVGAILFCNELSRLQGLDECYTENPKSLDFGWDCDFSKDGYRLPEEKEWEYVAKASTQNLWAGTNVKDELEEYAWFDGNSKIGGKYQTHPVKSKLPNEWGFYDMSGNVWEWCWDKSDPKNPDISANRVSRGGGWFSDASLLLSAFRGSNSPGGRDGRLGFRVCRSIVN